MAKSGTFSDELSALSIVLEAIEPLDNDRRAFVLKAAAERLDCPVPTDGSPSTPTQLPAGPPDGTAGRQLNQTPKQFLVAKAPTTDEERVACLGYYLTHFRDTDKFKTADITALNLEAAQPKFSNASASVNNATLQSGLLAPAAKSTKQISALGEQVVRALPDRQAANSVRAEFKKRRRKKRTNKKAAKTTTKKTTRKSNRKSS